MRFTKKWVPQYASIFREMRLEGGRVQIASRYAQVRQKMGNYVLLYDDERKPGLAMLMALLGEDGYRAFNNEAKAFTEQEAIEFLEYMAGEEAEADFTEGIVLPVTDQEWEEQEKRFQSLPENEKVIATKQAGFLWCGFFSHFFNTLALMTHGAKLTTLVPQAIAGDDDAFLKAVQVDRLLLTHHPYFIERKQRAQDSGEEPEFLRALAYRESNPNLKGPIRYPALFFLFGVLESIQWLDDLRHDEILDLCDEMGLDRFQSRIEDVNYLTKRLRDYRQFQKTNGVSMH